MQSGFIHHRSEISQSAGAFPAPGRVERIHGGNSARNPESVDALAGSLGNLSPEDEEAAQKTVESTVEEAKKFSNPDIPMPLKITGIVVLLYVIFNGSK